MIDLANNVIILSYPDRLVNRFWRKNFENPKFVRVAQG
jgi:hypothetical protein